MKYSKLGIFISLILSANISTAQNISMGTGQAVAVVEDMCDLNAPNIHFGELDFINKSGTFEISSFANVRCTLGTVYKLKIETIDKERKSRYLISATTPDRIEYNFYKKGTNILLGDSGDNDYIEGSGNGLYQRIDFNAKIDSNQNVRAGLYSDIVTINVLY